MRGRKTVCVAGPKSVPADKLGYMKQKLQEEIERALEEGYIFFKTALISDVGRAFAEVAAGLRDEKYPELFLEAVVAAVPEGKRESLPSILGRLVNGINAIELESEEEEDFLLHRSMLLDSERIIIVGIGPHDEEVALICDYAAATKKEARYIAI